MVYAFDPDGQGNVPVERMKDAAERYGFIIVGSNNSRNGSWKVESDSAQAMWDDTHTRFAIDDNRVYFAGFSGGARLASQLARQCKCAAGVLLNGAGFAGAPPSPDLVFAVFAAVGVYDFNYPELAELDGKLQQAGFAHVLRHFDGDHEWAPTTVMDEAFAWFQLVAIKQNRASRDSSFIKEQVEAAVTRAQALEQGGQSYEAWRNYRQAVETFAGLADTASLEQAAAALSQQKAVADASKREAQEFQEQRRLTGQIYSGLVGLRGYAAGHSNSAAPAGQPPTNTRERSALSAPADDSVSHSDTFHDTEQQIVDLRQRTSSEKHEDKLRVDRRALTGVFIAADEFGDEVSTAGDFKLAANYYQLATDAYPDSAGAYKDLASARALAGDRKGALEALRRAKARSKDPQVFSEWVNTAPAFSKLRDDPQFRALLSAP
jgi:tetratricopeptide (TPR) repeat protein